MFRQAGMEYEEQAVSHCFASSIGRRDGMNSTNWLIEDHCSTYCLGE
jgi:hypothetical protein